MVSMFNRVKIEIRFWIEYYSINISDSSYLYYNKFKHHSPIKYNIVELCLAYSMASNKNNHEDKQKVKIGYGIYHVKNKEL